MKTRAVKYWGRPLLAFVLSASIHCARAVSVAPEELTEAQQWCAARFDGVVAPRAVEPALVVLANHDPVQKNSRSGKPLRIVDQSYTHGLYCHAFSEIIVRLPAPGASFSAIVGVDSNEQTSGGRGSVDFTVSVAGAEKFRSGVMREGMAGKPVTVDLGGASDFILLVDPTPDGIACDQSDWADAKVLLKDGREIWLADLPLRESEPERVAPGTWLYTNNPAWLLGRDGDQKLLNLGHPEALQWTIDHFSGLIREQGVDLYRQDYNIDPLGYWRGADAPDREGITENHYVTGYLAYWDALLRRFPNLVIDTCASGGHRNDLETLRRAVPLLRSDYIMEPVGQQCHTCGLAPWIPFYGTGTSAMDSYDFRSQMCPHFTACFDMRRKDLPFDEARRLVNQWKFEIAPNYFGDFYALTPCTTANDAWMAWQFDRPEAGQGVVQAFRRANSIYESARLKLHGLAADTRYTVKNLDSGVEEEFTGRELMEKGLLVTSSAQPSAEVLAYRAR